ncbi:hypothetical protein ACFQZE_23805 [Paenibacillus sp. GCM10027627]
MMVVERLFFQFGHLIVLFGAIWAWFTEDGWFRWLMVSFYVTYLLIWFVLYKLKAFGLGDKKSIDPVE